MKKKNILISESQLEDLLKSLVSMITGGSKFDLSSLFYCIMFMSSYGV